MSDCVTASAQYIQEIDQRKGYSEQGWVREGSLMVAKLQHTSNLACAVLVKPSGPVHPHSQSWQARRPAEVEVCEALLDRCNFSDNEQENHQTTAHFAPAPLSPCVAGRSCICASVSALYNKVCVLCMKSCLTAQQQCLYNKCVLV